MDLTPLVLDRLLAKHPHLANIPQDAPEGIDSPLPPAPPIDWSLAGHILPIVDESDEEDLGDTCSLDSYDPPEILPTWGDWCLCIGGEIMAEVRKEVWDKLHYTCSAGIAHNKAMAKVSLP